MAEKKNKLIPIIIIAVVVVYIILWIFPLKAFYDFSRVEKEPYEPGVTKVFEIKKKFFLLPGPFSIWAVKTPDGFTAVKKFSPGK